jgi:hypothetical protein
MTRFIHSAIGMVFLLGGLSTDGQSANDAAERRETIRDAVSKANQPVDFYGQVRDQSGAPIPGVLVKLSLRVTSEPMVGAAADIVKELTATSDGAGKFELKRLRGAVLSVDGFEKAGYEGPRVISRNYWYAPATPDLQYTPHPNKPEMFTLWKRAGANGSSRRT